MIKKIGISILTFVLLVGGIYAFKNNNTNNDIQVVRRTDYPIASTIENLATSSDIIVIGEYKNFVKTWNMARDINDITKEASDISVLGDIYDFDVTKSLKGDIKNNSVIPVNIQRKNRDTIDEKYIAPELNKKIVLFLKKDANFGVYYATMEPFQFEILSNTSLSGDYEDSDIKVKSNLKSVIDNFSKDKKLKVKDITAAVK
jgi:hypothetical protein